MFIKASPVFSISFLLKTGAMGGCIMWAVFAFAQKNIADIRQFEQTRYAALLSQNWAALDAMLHPHLIYTHSNGTVEDKNMYLLALRSGKYVFRRFSTDSTVYHQYKKNVVVAAGVADMEGLLWNKAFQLRARFTAVYVKRRGRWQLAAWQSTKMAY